MNKLLIIIVSIISLLISYANCKNQYVYTINNENSHFKVIDIQNNEELVHQVLPVGISNFNVQYIYNETINNEKGSKFPILSMFALLIIGENINFYTIDYNVDKNSFLNNGTQIPYPEFKYPYYTEYESTPYSYINSNFYLPVQFNGDPDSNTTLLIQNWDIENETFKLLNYSENNSYQPPYGAMNMTSSLYYIMLFNSELQVQIQVIDYSNGKSQGVKLGLYKFDQSVLDFYKSEGIFVTSSGGLISINYSDNELSICTINLQLLSCQQEFSMELELLDNNNFNMYNFDNSGDYMIISKAETNNTKTIEYYYVNLSNFQIDYAYKTSNYFDTTPFYYYYN